MTDPFKDVSSSGPEMIEMIVTALENRAVDPEMIPIIDAYLAVLDWPEGAEVLEVGAGTGGITRRISAHAPQCRIFGVEPSTELVAAARERSSGIGNLKFEVGNAYALDAVDNRFHAVIFHTVLSHIDEPERALAEAHRVLKPGGWLVVCDSDFSKLALGIDEGDPLQACVVHFVNHFVTQTWMTAKLRELANDAGFTVESFRVDNRLDLTGAGPGAVWIKFAANLMVKEGTIGPDLAKGLVDEWSRRVEAGTAYGFNPFVTLIARC